MEIMIQHARNMLTFGQKDQDHIITFALIQLCKQKGLEEIKHFCKRRVTFSEFHNVLQDLLQEIYLLIDMIH